MSATDEMYLQNLDEFVNDENKIVTYKWLSRTLQVHVNVAKQMLFEFVKQQRNKNDDDKLNVIYAVAGVSADKHGNKYNKIQVIPEEQLEATKLQLKPVTSCHIYSIQRSKLQDTNSLYTTDYSLLKDDIFDSNKFSSISCSNAKLRNLEELQSLRQSVMPTQKEPAFKPETSSKQNSKSSSNTKQAGIAGMFSNTKSKSEKSASEESSKNSSTVPQKTKEKSEDKTTASKPAKGVMAFFANQANKPKKETTTDKKTTTTCTDKKTTTTDKKTESNKDNETKELTTKSSSKPSGKDSITNSRGKKQVHSEDEEPLPQKKRRRIKQQAWESSSEEEEEMEEEPPRSPSPPPREPTPPPRAPTPEEEVKENRVKVNAQNEVKVSSEKVKVNGNAKPSDNKVKGKRRKRVQKTKTYMNDEGFIVTEKVWESEYSDCSDDDVIMVKDSEPKVKVPEPSKVKRSHAVQDEEKSDKKQTEGEKRKKTPPKKKVGKAASNSKQMSMMSFFKKKD